MRPASPAQPPERSRTPAWWPCSPWRRRCCLLTGADSWRTQGAAALGLRPMTTSDGPAGARGVIKDERFPSSSLPCPSALGATWDTALVREVAAALGAEARSKGIDVLLGPTINLMRTPLGGRGFECFAEDPVLTAVLAVAYVRGLQSSRRGGDGQALRRQRLGDRALELRRAHRRERAARALPAALRGLRARGRQHAGHGRLQHGQRGPDDRARAAAQGRAQGRVGLRRRGHLRLARGAEYGGDGARRARPGHAGAGRAMGRVAGAGRDRRRGPAGGARRQGHAAAAARPAGRRAGRRR